MVENVSNTHIQSESNYIFHGTAVNSDILSNNLNTILYPFIIFSDAHYKAIIKHHGKQVLKNAVYGNMPQSIF